MFFRKSDNLFNSCDINLELFSRSILILSPSLNLKTITFSITSSSAKKNFSKSNSEKFLSFLSIEFGRLRTAYKSSDESKSEISLSSLK